MKLYFLIFTLLLAMSCSEETPQKSSRAKSSAPAEETDKSADAAPKEVEEVEKVEEEVEKVEEKVPVPGDDGKAYHSFQLGDGVCEFKFENKTKTEGCKLLLDASYSDCVMPYREKVHKIACEADKSFQEALDEVL